MTPVVVSPFSKSAEAATALALAGGGEIRCVLAATAEERALHLAIRHAVFVEEQGFFTGTDRDPHDDDPATLHVLGLCGGVASGAVRLYPLSEPGRWKGDRLAVLAPFRRHRVGAPLVRFAVASAADQGGLVMEAQVQPPNVAFFERLGWARVGDPAPYVGRLHQRMEIHLRKGEECTTTVPPTRDTTP